MTGRLAGRVAFVTGGASGIGAAIARRFASEGAGVILADVQDGSGLATEIGGLFVDLDVADEAGWRSAMETSWGRFGRLDVMVNNAGVVSGLSIEDIDLATWNRVVGINLTGVMLGCRFAIARMRANPGGPAGAIVNISSTAAYAAMPADPAYSATKSGVRLLSKSVAAHCARAGYAIRCNSLHPGATDTPILAPALAAHPELRTAFESMSPLGRMASPGEIAAAALFLASDDASYVTGAELLADGAMMAVHPGL